MDINKKPDFIFFDWDGTLVDSYKALETSHNIVLSEYFGKPPLKKGLFKKYFGWQRHAVYRAIYGEDMAEEGRKHFEKVFARHHCEMVRVIDGAGDLLNILEALAIKAGIVSNKHGPFVRAEIKHQGWDKYLGVIVASGEAERDKPSSDPLLKAMKELKANKDTHNIWYVGDSITDAKCAEEAEIPFVLVDIEADNDGSEKKDKSELYDSAQLNFKNCTALKDYLLRLA